MNGTFVVIRQNIRLLQLYASAFTLWLNGTMHGLAKFVKLTFEPFSNRFSFDSKDQFRFVGRIFQHLKICHSYRKFPFVL